MKEDLLKIINHYGVMSQLKYLQSEVFEFNEAIIQAEEFKKINDRYNIFNITNIEEEFADVMVMLEQFKAYYNLDNDKIIEMMKFKINRQLERINNENK